MLKKVLSSMLAVAMLAVTGMVTASATEAENSTSLKQQFAEKYGVKRGLSVTPDMEIPERYSTDFMDNVVVPEHWIDMGDYYYYETDDKACYVQKTEFFIPEDWDGYYNVYYFEAPDEWVNEHSDKKEENFEIGFYWYCGGTNNASWPGEPAKKLSVIDQNGNDIYADRNIYYGFAPTFASSVIWNNGISDWQEGKEDNKEYKLYTNDIKIDDPMSNYLSEKIYFEVDETIDGVDISGCLFYDLKEVNLTSSLTEVDPTVYVPKVAFFDPNTGETTDEPLKDTDGNYVAIPNEVFEYTRVLVNPYYDMDYTYVKEAEPPTEAPTEAPTQQATEAPTQASTQKPTQAPTNATTATQAVSNNSNGTVNTADSNSLKLLSTALLLSVAGVAILQKRKFYR